jgi:serine/threonine protein kinase
MSAMLLGNYRLIEKIGQGGMGEVWKAEDTRLGRTVAVKILPQAVAADAQSIARMKREARTAAQIYHPNIATIHAFEEAGDRIFIVMEYVEGEPLTQLIRRGPIAEADVCRIGRSVADALAEAHEKGIIHRDIKPDNIMVKGARVKVLDFGIAKQVEQYGQHGVHANDPTTVLTQQGMIIGTVFYMSPEQALGKPLDARTDLFSLGVVLYEAVTGRRPFHGDTATDTITRIVRDEAPLPQNVSRGLATIIHRCLRKDREDRFAGAHELSQALDAQLAVAPTAPLTTPAAAPTPAATTVLTTAPQVKPRSSPWMWIALIALFVIVTMVLSQRTKKVKEPVVSATTATTATTGSSVPLALGSSGAEQTVTAAPVITPTTTTVQPPPPEEPRTRVTEQPVPTPPAPTTTAVQPTTPSADADYNAGVTYLVQRQPMLARQSFEAALAKDPHHARAHFRLGEMALFLRDVDGARRELEAARADSDRLDARELRLTDLGLAVLDGDRQRAQALFQEIQRTSPNDPDLLRFRQMVQELRGEGPRPFRRGRLRPH